MTAWPETLPCSFISTTLEYEAADNLLRTEMSIGPAKVRRRSTAGVSRFTGDMRMTTEQMNAFKSFISTDIADGATPFTFPDPHGGVSDLLVRYVPTYRIRRISATRWLVSFAIEVLP